ncbi:peptidoglycan DD-metalloendopeptidase family protein [Aquipseudomonas ullengensis]|uniref:Peptidoglycan DD-metalloendopeptidase family protein n=1 Tax=Aquipseudomonas ullengensis TaxID=2759166 RepID=A0A7W4LM93_9GAMM|nr:peptidoglycan DD-metalloendopeptidase family protein [Pseudomonas ullengensis]MBB2495761.1 peptidoglycan DD-metalloendopeptidase family protein [Pseudomonas ullengensis]
MGRSGLGGVVFAVILSGCSSSPSTPVQVVDRTHSGGGAVAPSRPQVTGGQYIVQPGDTLYSIAFRFGWDWKALAARNNIAAPFVIRPGQRVRFDVPGGSAPLVAQAGKPVVAPITTQPATPVRPVVQQPVKTPLPQPQPQTPVSTPSAPVSATPAVAGKVQPVTRSAQGWAWPAGGVLIGKFSSNGSLNKGIDIAGELGQPVLAASDGTVVYAGSGLRGYGELVIIKHSDTYVSAYGHNRRLLVREGQQVKVGQHIAEMGSTGTDRVKLHFEIRRQGKPVDPLQYLPRR